MGEKLKRRQVLAGVAAVAITRGIPAFAHEEPPFEMPLDYLPTLVETVAFLPVGVIHVFPNQFRLYLTLPGSQALRYTVGIGRPGLYHAGQFTVGAKRKWPSWIPTPAMIARDPDSYARYADGMPGGINNPLGARALYLYDDQGRDSYLRIHGTNKPRTIGTAVSNGCARLTNDDIADLYDRVAIGTRVILHEQSAV